MQKFKYKHALLGGTFDHLHKGHEKFLNRAYQKARYISCGIVKKPKSKPLNKLIEPYSTREKNLRNYLKQKKYLRRTRLFPINNPLGPFFTDQSLEAVFATKDSFSGAKYLNKQRRFLNKRPLKISLQPLVSTRQGKLSSTKIRQGTTNLQGKDFLQLFKNNLILPDNQRKHFKDPIGKLLSGGEHSLTWAALQAKRLISRKNPTLIVTVGDISTHSLISNKIFFDLAVLDFKHRRKRINKSLHKNLFAQKSKVYQTHNPSSTITPHLAKTIKTALEQSLQKKGKQIITLQGEEDLSVLPLILLAPLKTLIFYGQPGQGLVAVPVNLKTKKTGQRLLNKFLPAGTAKG